MSSIGKQDTFWNLIKEYKIIVPKIQRDYVQGRENDIVKKNRKEFVEELIDSLTDENKPMSLNFVYGTIQNSNEFIPIDGQQRLTTLFLLHLYVFAKKGDKAKVERETLQKQFSYQTRYTTNRFLEDLTKNLPNLLDSSNNHVEDIYDLGDAVRISGWYVTPWDNDPNIHSCLVMLQTIHAAYKDKVKGKDIDNNICKRLKGEEGNNCPITFMWLQLDKLFGSDNQLYIRMNSRGKQLTDFENFKAELYEKILKSEESDSDEKKNQINDFKKKIDGEWYSLFWDAKLCRDTSNKNQDTIVENKDEDDIEKRATFIDRLLQYIFHWTIVSLICANEKALVLSSARKNDTKEYVKRFYSDLQPGCEIEKVYIQDYMELYQNWKDYEDEDNLEEEVRKIRRKDREAAFFKSITEDFACTLSFLNDLKEEKFFKFIVNDIFQINYGKKNVITYTISQYGARVLLYAITKFAKDYKTDENNDKIKAFKSWYRVVMNLVSTQEIDSPEDFQKAVRAIEGWNNNTADWLKNETVKVKDAFRPAQVKEEILKLDLMEEGEKNGIDWEKAIRNAENTAFDSEDGYKPRDYFRGQIGFLLHMAGVDAHLNDLDQKQLSNFVYYSKAVRCIFNYNNYWSDWESDEITNKSTMVDKIKLATKCSFDNLFHRAMLMNGNYWIEAPGNNVKTFFVYNESHNNYDWRGAFRQHLADDQKGKPQTDDEWGVAVGCLKKLLDKYLPFDRDDQDYNFDFSKFKSWLEDQLADKQISIPDDIGTTERNLLDLLIREPNCFKYIRNNYYVYWGDKDQPPKYLLMQLKRQREGSIIEITDKIEDKDKLHEKLS